MAGPWEKYEQSGPWERYEQPALTKSEKSRGLLQNLVGTGDMLLSMGTGMLAEPVAGWAGIGAGITGGADAAAEAVEGWRDRLTWKPRTEFAQEELGQMGDAMQKYVGQYIDKAGGAATDITGSPAAGAAVETGIAALPLLAGGKSVTRTPKPSKPKIPKTAAERGATMDGLRARADLLYKSAEDSGVIISAKSFDRFVKQLEKRMAEAGLDANLHPNATAVTKRLMERRNNNLSFKGADIERQVISDAAGSASAAERRVASIARDMYDDWINTLSPKDVLAGDPKQAAQYINRARDTWRTLKKAEIIDEAIELAGVNAGTYTGAGFENALRVAFRQLARKGVKNKRFRANFTDDEWAMIRRIANGGPTQNVLQWMGKLSIRSPVGGGVGAAAGAAALGPVGAVGVPIAAEGAKRGAAAIGIRNANRLFDDVAGP